MLAESSGNFGFLFSLLLLMGLTAVGVWIYYQVRQSTPALDRMAWTWKAIRPTNLAPFLDLSGISTIALNHVFFRQLRGKGHSQLRKVASSSQSLWNISAYLPWRPAGPQS